MRWNRNLAGIHSLRRASSLIIRKEENPIFLDRSAERAAELVLVECPASGRKKVARVEVRVAHEFEGVPVKCVRAGFRHHIDLAAAELAVFRVEVIRQNPELRDGIEVRNDCRAHIDVFFHVASIHEECVRKFPLAVDGNGPGIQITGRRKRARADILHRARGDGSGGNYARLKRQQIGKAASVQRNGSHLRAGYDFAHLRVDGLHAGGGLAHGDGFGLLADFERRVLYEGAVGIDHYISPPIRLESRAHDFDVVTPHRQAEEGIAAAVVRGRRLLDSRAGVRCGDGRSGNRGATRIFHAAGNASADAGPCNQRDARKQNERCDCENFQEDEFGRGQFRSLYSCDTRARISRFLSCKRLSTEEQRLFQLKMVVKS